MLLCYLISKTGWTLQYIYSLTYETYNYLLDGFMKIDELKNKGQVSTVNVNEFNSNL